MKILKFGTFHCGQCKMQDRELSKIKDIPVDTIDAEEQENLVEKYHIGKVPTVLVVNDEGEELLRVQEFIKAERLLQLIQQLKDSNHE